MPNAPVGRKEMPNTPSTSGRRVPKRATPSNKESVVQLVLDDVCRTPKKRPLNKESVVQEVFGDACQTPKRRRRNQPLTNAGLQDLVTALTVPKKTGGGEFKTCQMERFTRLVDLPVPSVLEVHAVEMTTIGGDEVGRVECVTVGKDGERYSTVILISKRHAAEIVALPCIVIYLGKKSQTNGNPYNWIVVVTEGNRRQANIPSDCVTREAADVFRNMKQGALEKIFPIVQAKRLSTRSGPGL